MLRARQRQGMLARMAVGQRAGGVEGRLDKLCRFERRHKKGRRVICETETRAQEEDCAERRPLVEHYYWAHVDLQEQA